MKILFLAPYPLKEAPSQRFRFEQYLPILKENGFDISFQSFWDIQTWTILYLPSFNLRKIAGFIKGLTRRSTLLFRLSNIDFVFIHRECMPIGPPVFEWIIAHIFRKKIIYDFDDAIWLPNTSDENKVVAFLKWNSKVASICKWSNKVSCGNSFLASYALQFNKNVIVNPTTIDTINLHNPANLIRPKKEGVVIGWTGTQSTLHYILPLIPVFKKLEKKIPRQVRLLIIANKDPKLDLEFVDFIPWSKQTEADDLLQMDIGIMPLSNDAWAEGKCGFKALQYMALEIPALVSPVGVNTEIVDDTINGYWCSQEEEWLTCLEKLIIHKELRREMGVAGRTKVINHYSVLSNSSTVLGLFS